MTLARAAKHTPGRMNKLEARYAERLNILKASGKIEAWWFEPVKLRLAGRTFYTPDFLVQQTDGTLSFVEVKGFWRDDARVKIKVAAETYPIFRWSAVQYRKGTWQVEVIGGSVES